MIRLHHVNSLIKTQAQFERAPKLHGQLHLLDRNFAVICVRYDT